MKKRNFKNIIKWLLLLGVISILFGVVHLTLPQADSAFDTKEDSMNPAYNFETKPIKIPPIDKAVPIAFKTASFGLG